MFGEGTKAENLSWTVHLLLTLFIMVSTTGTVVVLFTTGYTSGALFGFILNITGEKTNLAIV